MKPLDLIVVSTFCVSLLALVILSFFEPGYGLPGIALLLLVFGVLVLLIRRANRPTSASIAAMRIKR
ncbi:hypothetical protein [Alloyangia pacifica]|uniref:Uncharacterized protein n=1 Tax=Alloyangia pacifica TaxID=311180 RepID=A0A1I6W806_9RHOB|nr:hypothetical protein [Alloyangia pacifica]SDI43374.1 hypothetical protein SAMN04488245_1168 [Alloyangia pacifica]SFT22133.1 hypothetical protein SAMN04488050_1168 [Alloyangia pacifica]